MHTGGGGQAKLGELAGLQDVIVQGGQVPPEEGINAI